MSEQEGRIIKLLQIEATARGWRLFRNSVGMAWQGKECGQTMRGRGIILDPAYRVRYGLAKGSSDLVGWRPVVITADMVGQTIAQFVSIEAKSEGYKTATADQENWLARVAEAGGFASIAREKGDSVDIFPA